MEADLARPRPRRRGEVVELNVGGEVYATTRHTLTQCPDSMLGSMFAPRNEAMLARDAHGRIFIDRDGKLFRYVLSFLRDGRLCVGDAFGQFDALLLEAEFFALEGLKEEICALRASHERAMHEKEERAQRALTTALTRALVKSTHQPRSASIASTTPSSPSRPQIGRAAGSLENSPSRNLASRRRRRRTISLESEQSEDSTYSDISSEAPMDSIRFDEALFDIVPDF